jgi:hypothetical protein
MFLLQICESLIYKLVVILHAHYFFHVITHFLSQRFKSLSVKRLLGICVVLLTLCNRRLFKVRLNYPWHLIVELVVNQIDKWLWRLSDKDVVLSWNTRSKVINFAKDLFTIADKLTFIVEFVIVFNIGSLIIWDSKVLIWVIVSIRLALKSCLRSIKELIVVMLNWHISLIVIIYVRSVKILNWVDSNFQFLFKEIVMSLSWNILRVVSSSGRFLIPLFPFFGWALLRRIFKRSFWLFWW